MLGRLFKVRLKSAEQALADGRIDEAFRLATAPDLAKESRARKVLEQVSEMLFERAEEHYKAGRCAEALNDLYRCDRAGVDHKRVGDLRTIVRAAVDEADRIQHSRRQRLEAAQERLARGSLRAAEQILERASEHDVGADKLKQQAADRERRAEEMFNEVKQYINDNHLATAIARFRDARQLHPKNKKVAEWEKVLVDKIVNSVQHALREGRLSSAFEEIGLLEYLGDVLTNKAEVVAMLEVIRAAAAAVESADYDEARRKIIGLQHMLSGA